MKNNIKIFLLTVSILFSGCTVITPSKSEYIITPTITVEKADESSCKEQTIKIAQAFSDTSLMSKKMKYTYDEQQEFTYSESIWSRAPSRAISSVLLASIRDSELFKSVNSYKSRSRSDLILETNIEEFIQHYNDENRESFVKVVISFSLINSKTSKTIDNKTIMVEIEAESLNAQGGVKALNKALSEILQKNNKWLRSICK